MNRILFEPGEIDEAGRVSVRDGRASHIRKVLRAATGARLRAGVLDGLSGSAIVERIDGDAVALRCEWDPRPPGNGAFLELILALPRPKVLKRLWAPLASFGLDRLTLLNAARVERNYFDTHWIEPAHYRPLLIEGLQQAGLTRMPEVRVARRFRPFVEDLCGAPDAGEIRLMGHPSAAARLPAGPWPREARVRLAIGPEGGWTPFEVDLLSAQGFRAVSFGSQILRSDVACIAALALIRDRIWPEESAGFVLNTNQQGG